MEADLEGLEALGKITLGGVGELGGGAQGAGGGIGADLIREAAQKLPDGLSGDLAGEIPERQIKRPAAAVMELDVVQNAPMAFDCERILPDKKMLMSLKS